MISTTKSQLVLARNWLDETLPELYATNIADKLDVTTLHRLTPRRLDKPILTTASTAYADMLKRRTTPMTMTTSNNTQNMKPIRPKKFKPVDMTFDEQQFPALPKKAATTATTNTTTASVSSTSTTTSQTSTTSPTPAFDYKKELARLSIEIETTLKQHFEALFAQMDTKLDNFMKQSDERHAEQENFNETMTSQMTYIVDNMKRYLKLASPPSALFSPSTQKGEGKS